MNQLFEIISVEIIHRLMKYLIIVIGSCKGWYRNQKEWKFCSHHEGSEKGEKHLLVALVQSILNILVSRQYFTMLLKHHHKKGSKGGHSGSKKRRNHNRKKKGAHKKNPWDLSIDSTKMHVTLIKLYFIRFM